MAQLFYGIWNRPASYFKSIAMTNNEILKADLLDILFEHRNKSYGAYALRRYYNNRLLIALGTALSAVLLLFLISLLKGNTKQSSSWNNSDNNVVTITSIDIEPPKKIELPAPSKKVEPVGQVKDMTIKIVPDDKADIISDQKDIAENVISDKTVNGPPAEDLNKGVTNISSTGNDIKKEESKETEGFIPVEVPPSFPGGPEALALFFSRTLSSPTDLEPGEKKVVLVRFEVGADGSITKTEILQSGGDIHDREVLRAFKRMPRWNPAMQNGNKVATMFTQPVTFIGVEE